MSAWIVAIVAGVVVAGLQYAGLRGAFSVRLALLAGVRALAIGLTIALVLDAPVRPVRAAPVSAFIDGSLSMTRGGDSPWRAAWDTAQAIRAESLWVFGDTIGVARRQAGPTASTTRARPVVERAMATGRPAVLITDGEVQDSSSLDGLVSGSRIIVVNRDPQRDAALVSIDAPRAAVQGDSLALRLTLAAAGQGAAAGVLTIRLDDQVLGRWPFEAISPWAERRVDVRVRAGGRQGPTVLSAVIASPGDAEPRNDTLGVALELSRAASAVFVSTSPDQDARFAMAVLRGALALPTRGFIRVAPGRWRQEGSLSAVGEAEVRQALKEAPVAILHGDTAIFGSPQNAALGPLALIVPPEIDDGEWYVSAIPPSPLSGAMAAVPLDSLPPIAVGMPSVGGGDGVGAVVGAGVEDEN